MVFILIRQLVTAQHTSDAGNSRYWYDRLGRLVLSQNAKQILSSDYSYTLYDAIGRITEVGQINNVQAMDDSISRLADRLTAWINTVVTTKNQITQTVYDVSYRPIDSVGLFHAVNLRNRVAYTSFYPTQADLYPGGQQSATYYSYDIQGNVDTLLQDYKVLATMNKANRFIRMVYQYDLVSGKVNSVAYQPNQPDAFYHRYSYDAENRITNVEISHDHSYSIASYGLVQIDHPFLLFPFNKLVYCIQKSQISSIDVKDSNTTFTIKSIVNLRLLSLFIIVI